MQHADKWQVAVTLGEIEAVADDKVVRNFEADEISLDGFEPPRRLVEQDARLDSARLEGAELARDEVESFSGIEDIIDEQDGAAADVEAQFLGEHQVAGLGTGTVAGDTHEIEP